MRGFPDAMIKLFLGAAPQYKQEHKTVLRGLQAVFKQFQSVAKLSAVT